MPTNAMIVLEDCPKAAKSKSSTTGDVVLEDRLRLALVEVSQREHEPLVQNVPRSIGPASAERFSNRM